MGDKIQTWVGRFFVGVSVVLVLALGLSYCSSRNEKKEIEAKKKSELMQKAREYKLQKALDEGPITEVHKTSYGELLVVKVPKRPAWKRADKPDYVDCIVWRDVVLRRVSLSCPSQVDPYTIESAQLDDPEPGRSSRWE